MKKKRLLLAICLLLISATMLGTASFAWFSMNTEVTVDGIQVEAYSDSLFLEISKTGADDEFDTSVTLSDGPQLLRLAKHGFVGANNVAAYNLDVDDTDKATGNYTTSTDTTYLYKLIADSQDSYHKYVKVPAAELKTGSDVQGLYTLTFTLKTLDSDVADNTNYSYYEVNYGRYMPVTVADGEPVKGYYAVTKSTMTPAASAEFVGGTYYALDTDNSFFNVTGTLKLGTDLSAYYLIGDEDEDTDGVADDLVAITDLTAASGDVYLTMTGDDTLDTGYAYLGNFATATDLTKLPDALFFGRAYSDVIDDGAEEDTLSIIKDNVDDYYYTTSVYLRNALNTNNSTDLTASITVAGANNDLKQAIRVVLVVTDVTDANTIVNVVTYNGTTVAYGLDGSDDNIVDVLLGNKAETLKVDIYVYFDGSDANANNANVESGLLDGQYIDIKFNIEDHAYNQ